MDIHGRYWLGARAVVHETKSEQSLIEARPAEDDVEQLVSQSFVADSAVVLDAFLEHWSHIHNPGGLQAAVFQCDFDAAQEGRQKAMKFVVTDAGGPEYRFCEGLLDLRENLASVGAAGEGWVGFDTVRLRLEVQHLVSQPLRQLLERLGQFHLFEHWH